jgi:L-ascorbate metabolism protein UlaG (beta-lactamase superfamily)
MGKSHQKAPASEPDIHIHYLGHSSFILQFDNGITVLTDYGASNAYGLDSPIHDLGDLRPDVVTCSHTHHVDHYDASKAPEGMPHTLTEADRDSLSLEGLTIEPIPTCEKSPNQEDNNSYLFTYRGFKILHLGDAQGYITNLEQEGVRERVKEIYPDEYDLLLAPIGFTSDILPDAEAFIDLLQPKRVIPMHYWSLDSKAAFLSLLEEQNEMAGKAYHVQEIQGARYSVATSSTAVTPIQVISLEPAAFSKAAE